MTGLPRTEFDVLKTSHKFLRDEDEQDLSWDDQVAKKYYSSLFREYAVCDLKHYKSGNFALRWRTEDEVLSGAGQDTCGNTRCVYHEPSKALPQPSLTTLELPFAYEEHGERKSALVKVVLCKRCFKKLMWKREKQKELLKEAQSQAVDGLEAEGPEREGSKANEENRKTDGKSLKSVIAVDVERRRHRSIDEDHDNSDQRTKRSRHRHSP